MTPWIIWLLMGILFIVFEILTPTFYLLWFGVGAGIAALFAYFAPENYLLQITMFIISSAFCVFLTRRVANRLTGSSPRAISVDEVVGSLGVVTQTIEADGSKGLVKVGSEEWRATSLTEERIEKGTQVRVQALVGVKLIVKKLEKKEG